MNYYRAPLSFAKSLISKKKRRYKDNGFDLDLSYITPRIIAMGFPSEGAEGLFRNAMSEVSSFLTKLHKNHFKVFNLCAERSYDPAKLGGNVEWIPFADHNPAPTDTIYHFCELAYQWLSADLNNVIVVHCKAGKGVTIPSQKRYVFYFHELVQHGPQPVPALQLLQINVYSNFSLKHDVHLRVCCNGGNGSYQLSLILDSASEGSSTKRSKEGRTTSFYPHEVWVLGDVKIEVYDAKSSKKALFFYFWFNTAFIEGNILSLLTKLDLDKPSKNIELNSQTEVYFAPSPNETRS